jgi:hypothetical protein
MSKHNPSLTETCKNKPDVIEFAGKMRGKSAPTHLGSLESKTFLQTQKNYTKDIPSKVPTENIRSRRITMYLSMITIQSHTSLENLKRKQKFNKK